MQSLILLATFLVALPWNGTAAASLNKCIDAQGRVTYSNLPCKNAREAHKLEIDPAPLPDPVRVAPKAQAAKPAPMPERQETRRERAPATIQLETQSSGGRSVTRASPGKCDALTDKLGRVFDKMDAARRKGYTQEQMDDWNRQVKDLERQKKQAGCF
ncbi:MAG: DUF4124 domain-containing protein [Pseudomonadota bacterium]